MPQERKAGNDFSVSVEVRYNPECILSDELENTVSYAELYEIVKQEMEMPRKLLECVAGHIVERITEFWPIVESGRVTITKLTPPIRGITGSAAVSLDF